MEPRLMVEKTFKILIVFTSRGVQKNMYIRVELFL